METSQLELRVATLERRSRALTGALAALMALVGLSALVPQEGAPAQVRARCFSLVDEEGRARAELSLQEGTVGLFLRDTEERDRAMLVHDAEQSALYLLDEEGTIRVGSAQYAHGGGGHALHGPGSKGATVLYQKDGGSLTFYGEDGEALERIAPR